MLDAKIFDEVLPNNEHVPAIYKKLNRNDLTQKYRLRMSLILYGFSFGDKMWGKRP